MEKDRKVLLKVLNALAKEGNLIAEHTGGMDFTIASVFERDGKIVLRNMTAKTKKETKILY